MIGNATNQNFATAANVYGVEVLLAAVLRINSNVPGQTCWEVPMGKVVSYDSATYPSTAGLITGGTQLFPTTWVPGQTYTFRRCHLNAQAESGTTATLRLQTETFDNGNGIAVFLPSSGTGPMVTNTDGSLVTALPSSNNACWNKTTMYLRITGTTSGTNKYIDAYFFGIVYP